MRLFIVYISPPAHRPPICGPRIIIPSTCVLVGPRRHVTGSLTAAGAIFNFHFHFLEQFAYWRWKSANQEEWTETFAFILPPTSTRSMCLIYQETIAVIRISNLKRHYETRHRNFEETIPQNSEVRITKINALKLSYQVASRILVTSVTQQKSNRVLT